MKEKVVEFRQMLQILAMFMIVQFFGLLLAIITFSGATMHQVATNEIMNSYVEVLFYIVYIAIAAAILILIFKYINGRLLFKILEAIFILISSFFVFYALIDYAIANNNIAVAISIIAAIALIFAKNKFKVLRNTAAIIGSVGIGFVLGLTFTFETAYIFMGILAIYDFIAVFITKHMLSLARLAEENNLALMVGVNEIKGVPEKEANMQIMKEAQKEYKKSNDQIAQIFKSKKLVPILARLELGNGDLGVPLMVAIAAYGATMNFVLSFFVIFGAIIGLIATMAILKRYKRALPAIPPLFAGITIFVGLYMLLF
ncbi:MAG: presenilin family intramembrane aspartyl protease [Candidatus Micrarchaeaceae archaeon]